MTLSLQKLRSFVAVSEERNFLRAAQKLGITQPTLSAQIRELEADLDVQLLNRTTRQVQLTIEGDRFLQRTRRILADIDVAVDEAKQLASLQHGRVSIASTPSAAATFLPVAIAKFQEVFPEIIVHLREDVAPAVDNMVRMGIADFGIGPKLDMSSDLSFVSLIKERFMAVVPPGHVLVDRAHVTLEDLVAHKLIPTRQGSGIQDLVDAELRGRGMAPDPSLELMSRETVVAMVEAGLGVALLPELTLSRLRSDLIRVLPLSAPGIERDIGFIEKKGGSSSAAASAFLDLIRTVTSTSWSTQSNQSF